MITDIEARINEAEVCRSMGLYGDSLDIYESILSLVDPQDDHVQATIHKRINLLKIEIGDQEEVQPPVEDESDAIIAPNGPFEKTDTPDILASAAAFQEMGLYPEAITEYEKLFKEEYPLENLIPLIAECLLKLHSPAKVIVEFNQIVGNQNLEEATIGHMKFLLGQEMEKREHRDQAQDLYREAGKLDPSDTEIEKRLASITATTLSGSKYDYLLKEGIVSTDQLQKAFALSKKMNKSVEFVLIEQYQVEKETIGKSFSLFYNCPYRPFDDSIPIPVELLTNLKKTFLLNEIWVPLSWDKNGMEVLIDDPRNLNKTDNIKTLMKTTKINFSVAIREDIQQFIKVFFDEDRQTDEVPAVDEVLDDFDLIPDISFEEEEEDVEFEEADEASSQVVRLVDQTIIAAYRKNASDIHIEPSPVTKATTIRFRLDGVCQEYMKVPNSIVRGIISRVKIMSNLDIAEKRLPQDGKIKFKRKGVPAFELRVATLPTAGGYEDVVMRILASAGAMKIDEMGLTDRNLEVLR
ncbi:MAG: ATPase, T2SS/T4P/T4SS family, partial [Desulfobacterales bacterium]